MLIKNLFERDIFRPINGVVKADQLDDSSVWQELDEFVITRELDGHFRKFIEWYLEAVDQEKKPDPAGKMGIWISGFFGSGKSSFAKNLGYALSNPNLLGKPASQLFKDQVEDRRIAEFLDLINVKIPTEVVMFDVSKGSEVRRAEEKIAAIVYRALLSHLDYATDYDVAELEIELEGQKKLDAQWTLLDASMERAKAFGA